jgi:pimeloyl-ACP methyl ester carboxylesterase
MGYADTPLGQLHYAECGSGSPALLLLHQAPRSWDEYREVLPLFGASRRTVAMDMRGFAGSPDLPAPQSIEQYAEGALALLDSLGIDDVTVLGHHTGALVALEVAATAPERVSTLVMSSSPYNDAEWRSERDSSDLGVDDAEIQEDGSHLTTLWALRLPYYPAGRPDLLDRFVRDALAPGIDPAEGHRAVHRYVMEDRIGQVRARTLVLCAAGDPFAMPHVSRLTAALTGAAEVRSEIIAEARIPVMEERPAEVVAAVERFLAG